MSWRNIVAQITFSALLGNSGGTGAAWYIEVVVLPLCLFHCSGIRFLKIDDQFFLFRIKKSYMSLRTATGIHIGKTGCHLVCGALWTGKKKLETDSRTIEFHIDGIESLSILFLKLEALMNGKINVGYRYSKSAPTGTSWRFGFFCQSSTESWILPHPQGWSPVSLWSFQGFHGCEYHFLVWDDNFWLSRIVPQVLLQVSMVVLLASTFACRKPG